MKIELLAPAGNPEKLKMAIIYGADAVYLAGPRFGLRAGAGNFTLEEMKEGIKFAHERNRKVYVTMNIIPHNEDFEGMEDYIALVSDLGADAVIVSDLGVLSAVREVNPSIPVHISTQANVTNYKSAMLYKKLGASRIIAAGAVLAGAFVYTSTGSRYRNRGLCSWGHVYFLFRQMPFKQLYVRKRRKQG